MYIIVPVYCQIEGYSTRVLGSLSACTDRPYILAKCTGSVGDCYIGRPIVKGNPERLGPLK